MYAQRLELVKYVLKDNSGEQGDLRGDSGPDWRQ